MPYCFLKKRGSLAAPPLSCIMNGLNSRNQGDGAVLSAVPNQLNLVLAVGLDNDVSAVELNTEVDIPGSALTALELFASVHFQNLGQVGASGLSLGHGQVGIPVGAADIADDGPCLLST